MEQLCPSEDVVYVHGALPLPNATSTRCDLTPLLSALTVIVVAVPPPDEAGLSCFACVSAIEVEYVSVRAFVQNTPLELKLLEPTVLVEEKAAYVTPEATAAATNAPMTTNRLTGSAPAT